MRGGQGYDISWQSCLRALPLGLGQRLDLACICSAQQRLYQMSLSAVLLIPLSQRLVCGVLTTLSPMWQMPL